MKKLRGYQVNVFNEIENLLSMGEKSFFIKLPMATGKTVCANEFCNRYSKGKILVIGPKESKNAFDRDFDMDFDFYNYELVYSIYKNNAAKFERILNDYSVIIMDEAHKTGAELLSKALMEIKIHGKYDYFIGMSAHSRRMDQRHTEEDQCDVLFDGNLVGNLDLDYCFENNILMEPDYFYCEAKLSEEIESEIRKLQNSKLPIYLKKTLIDNLQAVKLSYDNFSSLDKTLKRGLRDYKDIEGLKIIVFISRIDKYEDVKDLLQFSFNNIFNCDINYYPYFNNASKKVLNDFLNDGNTSVLFTVNKGNLSLHHPKLRVAIQYRKTTSAIVYEQQLGRVLFRDQKGCIIDIVDNGHTVQPLNFVGDKSPSSYIIDFSHEKNSFKEKVAGEFDVNYCKYKELLSIIRSKSYRNISFDYKGESGTIKHFAYKYRRVFSDIYYFINKDIPFDRALEAARSEQFLTIKDKEYSADLLAKRFNLDADKLRFDIKNGNFKLTTEMADFFDVDDSNIDNISLKVKELENLLKEKYNE